ncbi:MAG: HypC/HybG/HupF family hydrogenase formation chaperone [Polyangiaceae bacterium]|nr:HypC/HybG/HupF family hydrogenase formation chaperone [Polyangiaceae bacterium]
MCLGVPGRVVELREVDGLKMGRVDFGGVCRLVCLEHVDAAVGDHVLVHVGFALTKLAPEEASELSELLEQVAAELDPDGPPDPGDALS